MSGQSTCSYNKNGNERTVEWLTCSLPCTDLQIVMEHITTRAAVEFVSCVARASMCLRLKKYSWLVNVHIFFALMFSCFFVLILSHSHFCLSLLPCFVGRKKNILIFRSYFLPFTPFFCKMMQFSSLAHSFSSLSPPPPPPFSVYSVCRAQGANVAATITCQHLLHNRNVIFDKGLRPHRVGWGGRPKKSRPAKGDGTSDAVCLVQLSLFLCSPDFVPLT